MPSPKKDLSIEETWLSEQDASQQTRFLKEFCPKSEIHNLEGIRYPISNAKAVDILIRCRTNNKYLKRIGTPSDWKELDSNHSKSSASSPKLSTTIRQPKGGSLKNMTRSKLLFVRNSCLPLATQTIILL